MKKYLKFLKISLYEICANILDIIERVIILFMPWRITEKGSWKMTFIGNLSGKLLHKSMKIFLDIK